jgi:hypothetical protein
MAGGVTPPPRRRPIFLKICVTCGQDDVTVFLLGYFLDKPLACAVLEFFKQPMRARN